MNVQHIRDTWILYHSINKDFILSSELSSMYKLGTIYFDSNIAFNIASSFIDTLYAHDMILNISDDFDDKQRTSISNMMTDRSVFRYCIINSLRYISDCYENLLNEHERFHEFLTRNTGRIFIYPGFVTLLRIYVLCSIIDHLNVDDSLLFPIHKNIGYTIEEYFLENSQDYRTQIYSLNTFTEQKSKLTIKVKLESFISIIKHLINKMKNRTYTKKTFVNRLHTYNQLKYFNNKNPQQGNLTVLLFFYIIIILYMCILSYIYSYIILYLPSMIILLNK